MSNCEHSQLNSMSSRSDTWLLLVFKFWASTLESTSSLISIVPSCFSVTGTLGRWLSKKTCLWDNSNCQAARGSSYELIVILWTKSIIAIVTESGPKSRVHWIPSLETEKIMIFCKLNVSWVAVDCRLKLIKMIWKLNTSLKSSANWKRIRWFHNWTHFNLLWFRFGCAWLWLAEKFLQKWRWFFFFVVATRLSCKTMCTVTAKQHNCRFLVLKRNIQNVAAGFALFKVVETGRFICWNVNTLFISTCWTLHISDSLLYFVVHTQFFLSIFGWLKWDFQ